MPGKKPALLGKRARHDPSQDQALSDADLAALDEFCAGIASDDVGFDEWESCHSRLDLSISTTVDAALAATGGDLEVCYSRTVQDSASGGRPVREKIRLSVKIPAGSQNGTRIRVVGQGDLAGGRAGDLEVKLRVS